MGFFVSEIIANSDLSPTQILLARSPRKSRTPFRERQSTLLSTGGYVRSTIS